MQENKEIKFMQYMGIKHKLLKWMKPYFLDCMENKNGYMLDLMAGSCSVSVFFKQFFPIISNDIQYYSYVIGKAIVENDKKNPTIKKLNKLIENSKNQNTYNFFYKNYSDTYFTSKVCKQIDNISYGIDKLKGIDKYLYKYLLILSMNKIRLTTGHYAQFLDSKHPRMKNFLNRDLFEQMKIEIENFSLIKNFSKNYIYNYEDKELFNKLKNKDISLIYIDPPYSGEQYSRFYHILETVTKYDNPELDNNTKALYRKDRYKSDFCYKGKGLKAFEKIFEFGNEKGANIIISYSNKGILKINDIENLLKKYYTNISIKSKKHKHSSLSKGASELNEILIIGKGVKKKGKVMINKQNNIIDISLYEKNLIRYIGNKRKLLKNFLPIFQKLYKNGNKTFLDLFSGSGAISRLTRGIGYITTANDWEDYSYIINKTFLEFNNLKDNFKKVGGIDNILETLNNLNIKKGFFYKNFGEDSKEGRKFFTAINAGKIDSINDYIEELYNDNLINKNEYFYLKTSLILAISKFANITGVFRAFLKQFNGTSKKGLILEKIFIPNGPKGKVIKENAEKYKCYTDIVYIDPPYNEHQYSPNYHILNHIYQKRTKLNGIAGVYDYSATKSTFCNEEGSKKGVENILNNIKAKYILFSYNNNGLIRIWELYEILSKYGDTDIEIIDYPRYRAHNKRTPLLKENYEHLLICNVGKKTDKGKYQKNIELLKQHPGYNRRRKDDKGKYKQRKGI